MAETYFLHCPKTGGRYINDNVVNVFRSDMAAKQIVPSKHLRAGHDSWGPVHENPNIFIFSLFRDPVKRVVSHYCYFYAEKTKISITPKGLFETIYRGDDFSKEITNYQSQFIMANNRNFYHNNDQYLEESLVDEDLLLSRFNQIDLKIPTENLSRDLTYNLLQKVYLNSGFVPPSQDKAPYIEREFHKSIFSKELYEMLSDSEKEDIRKLNYLDDKLYQLSKETFSKDFL